MDYDVIIIGSGFGGSVPEFVGLSASTFVEFNVANASQRHAAL